MIKKERQVSANSQDKAFYIIRIPQDRAERRDVQLVDAAPAQRLATQRVVNQAKVAFIVQASVRKLVFNDKECYILILKNLTSAF